MNHFEDCIKAQEFSKTESSKKGIQKKAKLSDANSDVGLTNPSLMLWALLGLSADHSYLLIPLS